MKEWKWLRKICQVAKDRCINLKNHNYKNYGGRGIKFCFQTGSDMALWISKHLGHRPSAGHSLDRQDNNKWYEPGNLQWATRSMQGQNKRIYRRSVNGERIRFLQTKRKDLTYETFRTWIKEGLSDEQIIVRVKGKHDQRRIRYSKLRA